MINNINSLLSSLKSVVGKIYSKYVKPYKSKINYGVMLGVMLGVMCLLALVCVLAINRCSKYKSLNGTFNDNISALTDTIKYYKSKSNQLVAEKTMLCGDMDLLKKVNDSLYNKVKDIKIKNPDNVVYISTTIVDSVRDTCWVVPNDSIYSSSYIKKEFNFSDDWRQVQGYTYLKRAAQHVPSDSSVLGTVILKNNVRADFTVVQKDNKVYVTSNNPYIEYTNIIGITNSQENKTNKIKRWGIGPYIGFGVTHKLDFVPSAGLSVHYSIIRF